MINHINGRNIYPNLINNEFIENKALIFELRLGMHSNLKSYKINIGFSVQKYIKTGF